MMSFFTLFWNGLVGSFVFGIFNDFGQGADWFSILFMVPFVLVGLLLLGFVFYLLGGLFNPTVEIALSTGAVQRGELVDVAWQLSGRTSSIKSLKVIPVADANSLEEIEFGSEAIPIPANTMHTFLSDRNSIKWRIVVHGKIPYWPNIKETFDFRVKP